MSDLGVEVSEPPVREKVEVCRRFAGRWLSAHQTHTRCRLYSVNMGAS